MRSGGERIRRWQGLRAAGPGLLALDTATATVVAGVGTADGRLLADGRWPAEQRHVETLLPAILELLGQLSWDWGALAGIVVGTGPGGFTGLRVGLATAKGLARALGVPVAGVATTAALLAAARAAEGSGIADRRLRSGADPASPPPAADGPAGRAAEFVVVLPAGPSERVVAVDVDDADPEACLRGRRAMIGLAAALLVLGAARLADGGDDPAALVPAYLRPPRGVSAEEAGVTWWREPR